MNGNEIGTKARISIYIIAVVLTLVVFTATVLIINFKLKTEIKNQILNRDAEMMVLFSQANYSVSDENLLAALLPFWLKDNEASDQSLPASKLQGIIAVQVFDLQGNLLFALPESIIPSVLSIEDRTTLQHLKPISRFYSSIWLNSLFYDSRFLLNAAPISLLEITVPVSDLQSTVPQRYVQYWIDGKSMAQELSELDRHIFWQTAVALGGGYLIILAILSWAFRQLHSALQKLKQQTSRLIAANRELVLSAKSSAVGSVSAYLFHGLKSPLTGLQDFLANQAEQLKSNNREQTDEWQSAQESMRRINHLIREIVQIIQEEDNPEGYELSLAEIIELLVPKIQTIAQEKKMALAVKSMPSVVFSNRTGNLLVLILDNLVKNAMEASQPGSQVTLEFLSQEGMLEIHVRDQGHGLPESIRANLFKPCISSKPGGNGIGLAVSHQLAKHIGAELFLQHSDVTGSLFILKLRPEKQ